MRSSARSSTSSGGRYRRRRPRSRSGTPASLDDSLSLLPMPARSSLPSGCSSTRGARRRRLRWSGTAGRRSEARAEEAGNEAVVSGTAAVGERGGAEAFGAGGCAPGGFVAHERGGLAQAGIHLVRAQVVEQREDVVVVHYAPVGVDGLVGSERDGRRQRVGSSSGSRAPRGSTRTFETTRRRGAHGGGGEEEG
jgi:hypothetical protein